MKKTLLLISFLAAGLTAWCQQPLPYKNPALPISQRVADLLGRMSLEEKFRQLFMVAGDLGKDSLRFKEGIFGFQVNTTSEQGHAANQMMQYQPGQDARETAAKINAMQRFFVEDTRLGIPIIAFDEALHGLVRTEATAFPQSIALAATFDTALVSEVSKAIASECKSRGIRLVLSPVLNLATDVRWGRVEETYGEDPYLSACMGVAYVKAFERHGIITTPKHFIVNHGDGGRDSYPIYASERMLEETYLVPFRAVIEQAGARGIMTAYNSLDGRPCTANNWLLNEKLKKQMGFRGIVISDAAATGGANVLHFTASDYEDAGQQSIENGLDVIFQTGFESYDLFKKPFLEGKVDAAKLDSAVARVLRLKMELGLFEHPYVSMDQAAANASMKVHRQLAKKAAAESAVLLKNDQHILPLSSEDRYKTIAVIGTDAVEARLGGYSGPGKYPLNLLEGLQQMFPDKKIRYAPGCGRTEASWPVVKASYLFHDENGKTIKGLKAQYFNNITCEGTPVVSRTDEQLDFQWTLFSPAPAIHYDFFSVRWTGHLQAPVSGAYQLGIEGNDGYRLYLDDQLILDTWNSHGYNKRTEKIRIKKDQTYRLRIDYKEASGSSRFRLVWNVGLEDTIEKNIREAIHLAKKSDLVIVVAGIEEGEFRDRSTLKLPGHQEELLQRLGSRMDQPLIVVLSGGSAVTMNAWIDKAWAVLDMWYPGEAGGEAIAELIAGKQNPSGKLPITFPATEGQLPLIYNHKPTGRGDDYDDASGKPLFPFGYGLSYTQFEYTQLALSRQQIGKTDTLICRFKIKNTGSVAGEEVVQLYLHDELASTARPVKELKGFQRVRLEAGEEKELIFRITPSMLTLLDADLKPVIELGAFRLMIGSSSTDIRLRTLFNVK